MAASRVLPTLYGWRKIESAELYRLHKMLPMRSVKPSRLWLTPTTAKKASRHHCLQVYLHMQMMLQAFSLLAQQVIGILPNMYGNATRLINLSKVSCRYLPTQQHKDAPATIAASLGSGGEYTRRGKRRASYKAKYGIDKQCYAPPCESSQRRKHTKQLHYSQKRSLGI